MRKTFYTLLPFLFVSVAMSQTPSVATPKKSTSLIRKEPVKEAEFSIFPNPSSNFIKVRSTGALPDAVSVHDISGMKLMEDKGGGVLNVYSLPRGIYYVHVRAGNRIEKIRFEKL